MYVCVRVLMKIVGWYEWNGMEMESRLGPASEAKSTQYSREVAKHLKESGAKMYGAFWCSHCEDQKETFGAGADIPYVVRRLFVFLDFLFFISTSFFLFLCPCFFGTWFVVFRRRLSVTNAPPRLLRRFLSCVRDDKQKCVVCKNCRRIKKKVLADG